MPVATAEFNRQIIEEFRASEGRCGGRFEGVPLLLLTHTGAKSGKVRTNPMGYLIDKGRYIVFASKGGYPVPPDWYHNLKAHPRATIEVGTETIEVVASDANDEDRERYSSLMADRVSEFGDYLQDAGRIIPAVVLTPTTTG